VRATADETLTTNLTNEANVRAAADALLTTNLEGEVNRATASEALKMDIVNVQSAVTKIINGGTYPPL
jgi:hypothetical protein